MTLTALSNKTIKLLLIFLWSQYTHDKQNVHVVFKSLNNSKALCSSLIHNYLLFSHRCGSVTLPLPHHAEFPAQDAGATLHPETCREKSVTGSPACRNAHPCCWGSKVCHHLPCVLTGRDGRQRGPAGKEKAFLVVICLVITTQTFLIFSHQH